MLKRKNKVYVIDTDEKFLNVIKESLYKSGLEVRIFHDADEAKKQIYDLPPELVLIDYDIPPANARDFINSLASEGRMIPFMIMTSHGDQRLAVEMMKLGAVDCFLKDEDFINKLPSAIKKLFSNIENEKEIADIKLKYNRARNYYLSLLEELSTMIWRCDREMKRDFFNKTWLDFTGCVIEKEMYDGWLLRVHLEDREGLIKKFNEAFIYKNYFEMEYRLLRYDGKYRWLIDYGKPFYDLEGNFAGYIGSCVDITDRKHAEEELIKSNNELEQRVEERTLELKKMNETLKKEIEERRLIENTLILSENKYRELVELSSEGYWVLDKYEKTVFFNKRISDLLGYENSDLELMNPCKFMDATNASILSEKINRLKTGERQYGELAFISKNGFSKIVKASLSPIYDSYSLYSGALMLLTDITDFKKLEEEIKQVRFNSDNQKLVHGIVAKSDSMQDIIKKLPVIAENNCNVLIEGPSGTGKSVIAKAIHRISDRRDSPFVIVNCGAIPDALLESELFGYMKGAFTDAKKDKPGKLSMAEGGTLFLDEIGEMPLLLQVKLLRIIEEKKYEPLGGVKTMSADVRIIAATNKDLKELIALKKFREDLYYRLKIVSIKLPSLKERREDAIAIMMHYIEKLNSVYQKNINLISEKMREFMNVYDFPGNIRELQNILEYAVMFAEGNALDVKHLPPEYHYFSGGLYGAEINLSGGRGKIINNQRREDSDSFLMHEKHTELSESDEKEIIVKTLELFNGNRIKTSNFLKISRMQLWRKMKKYLIS